MKYKILIVVRSLESGHYTSQLAEYECYDDAEIAFNRIEKRNKQNESKTYANNYEVTRLY